MEDDDAFRERVLRQRWFQGALIPWKGDLARDIARVGLRECDLRAAAGLPAAAGEEPDGQFVLISQLCDLAVGGGVEPFAVAIPAGRWDLDRSRQLPGRNSSRWFVLEAAACLVASQARPIPFAKELLPDQDAVQPPINAAMFATWCARRWRRIPLPDDFTETVQTALGHALDHIDHPDGLGATLCWRVEFLGDEPGGLQRARLIAVYDPQAISALAFNDYVREVTDRTLARLFRENEQRSSRLPGYRPYTLETTEPVPANQLSIQIALELPMMTFDHLSPVANLGEVERDHVAELTEEDLY